MILYTVALIVSFAIYFVLAEVRIARVTRQRSYWHERYISLAATVGEQVATDDEQESAEAP
jgi:hypothetical protein